MYNLGPVETLVHFEEVRDKNFIGSQGPTKVKIKITDKIDKFHLINILKQGCND